MKVSPSELRFHLNRWIRFIDEALPQHQRRRVIWHRERFSNWLKYLDDDCAVLYNEMTGKETLASIRKQMIEVENETELGRAYTGYVMTKWIDSAEAGKKFKIIFKEEK